jgi:hypothetical protein
MKNKPRKEKFSGLINTFSEIIETNKRLNPFLGLVDCTM